MPIIDQQRAIREAGRIRLGQKVDKGRPEKLDRFRFTSGDREAIEKIAALYGGDAHEWKDSPLGNQWEVLTDARSIDVAVVPNELGFSQFYELWSGSGCQRRCDGERQVLVDEPCACDPEDRECKPHTRLSVMLRDLDALGLWRLDTQGWNAARELYGAFELVRHAALGVVPARLMLEERRSKRPGQQAKRFVVPVLDLSLSMLLHESPAAAFTPVPELPAGPDPSIAEQIEHVANEGPGRERTNAAEKIRPTNLRALTEECEKRGIPATKENRDAIAEEWS